MKNFAHSGKIMIIFIDHADYAVLI